AKLTFSYWKTPGRQGCPHSDWNSIQVFLRRLDVRHVFTQAFEIKDKFYKFKCISGPAIQPVPASGKPFPG
ncbi:hypothetical protein, partial [Pseudomonas aeruginosa]|uniref:hypothetical protein n=1 Tax=Pseudomonas aeruginosa TaxID=287 RepID=UPI0019D4AC99